MKLTKSSCVATGRRPIHKRTLKCLLRQFGIETVRDPVENNRVMLGKRANRSLWDIWELVQKRWKLLRKKLHPDVNHVRYDKLAVMSAIYDTIMLRLKQRGICAAS